VWISLRSKDNVYIRYGRDGFWQILLQKSVEGHVRG
jgi:hypothetical protein